MENLITTQENSEWKAETYFRQKC